MQIAPGLPRAGAMAAPAVRFVHGHAQIGWRLRSRSSLIACAAAIIALSSTVRIVQAQDRDPLGVKKPILSDDEAIYRVDFLYEEVDRISVIAYSYSCRTEQVEKAIERLEYVKSRVGNMVFPRGSDREAEYDQLTDKIGAVLAQLKALPPCKLKSRIRSGKGGKGVKGLRVHPPKESKERPEIGGSGVPRTEAASFIVEPRISFGLGGSSGTSSYDSTGGQAPFNGDWSHSTGEFCGGATFYPGFVFGPVRVGADVNVCSGSKTFGSGDATLFAIMRHGPGDVALRSSTNVIIDTLVKAEIPLGNPEVEYDSLSRRFFVSVGVGPTFREQNLNLTSDQSFFGGGIPSIRETTWQTGFAVSAGLSTFVCPTCIAGNPLKVGIEGRARFFPSQSISLTSPVFGFTEAGSTGSTTDYSAQVTLSVPMGYGPILMTGRH
jgi:hypothetical protein